MPLSTVWWLCQHPVLVLVLTPYMPHVLSPKSPHLFHSHCHLLKMVKVPVQGFPCLVILLSLSLIPSTTAETLRTADDVYSCFLVSHGPSRARHPLLTPPQQEPLGRSRKAVPLRASSTPSLAHDTASTLSLTYTILSILGVLRNCSSRSLPTSLMISSQALLQQSPYISVLLKVLFALILPPDLPHHLPHPPSRHQLLPQISF